MEKELHTISRLLLRRWGHLRKKNLYSYLIRFKKNTFHVQRTFFKRKYNILPRGEDACTSELFIPFVERFGVTHISQIVFMHCVIFI